MSEAQGLGGVQVTAAKTQTHWREVHRRMNENLLFAEDLNGRTSVVMEIVDSGVIGVSDGDKKKDMPWIAFKGRSGKALPKVLALNATNCKAMQTITGTGVIEQWRGPVELVVVRTRFKDRKTGEQQETDAIRIAPKRPQMNQPAFAPAPPDTKTTTEPPPGDGYTFDPDAPKED